MSGRFTLDQLPRYVSQIERQLGKASTAPAPLAIPEAGPAPEPVVRVEQVERHETAAPQPARTATNRRREPVDEASLRVCVMVLETFGTPWSVATTDTQRNAVLEQAARWVEPRLDAALAVCVATGRGGPLRTDGGLPHCPTPIIPLSVPKNILKTAKKNSVKSEVPKLGSHLSEEAIHGEGIP